MPNPNDSKKAPKFTPLSGENFVTLRSQSRCNKKREFHKLAVAHSDIHDAHEASVHFLNIIRVPSGQEGNVYAGMDHPLYRPLLSAIILPYARPFTPGEGFGVLKNKWAQFDHPKWAQSHARILKARHELYAHSDALVRSVRIHPPGEQRFLAGKKIARVGYSIRGYLFTHSEIETIADLTYDLGQRLHAEVERLLKELYQGLDLPNKDFWLRFDEGL
jgi:hypothetical protein